MKVFDCFTFFNELDLLEFRLKWLDPHVDCFVIAESNLTHSGQSKPFYFEANRNRFRKWENKIHYIPLQQDSSRLVFEEQHHYNPESAAWQLENEQRNALLQITEKIADHDLVLISDLDEIPAPAAIGKAKKSATPIAFSLLFHYYFLNCQNTGQSRWWKGSIAATGKQFREKGPQGLRENRDHYPALANGGWHFSFLGGMEKIREKLEAFAHTEFNKTVYTSEENINKALDEGEDILRREGVQFRYLPLSYYPNELQQIMKEYPALLRLPEKKTSSNLYYTARRIWKGQY